MAKARMTQAEFDALRPNFGRITADTIEVAHVVLVQGVTPADAAVRYSMSRQRIHGIIQRFRAAAQAVPTGWRRVEIWLPPELAAEVEKMAEKARADYQAAAA